MCRYLSLFVWVALVAQCWAQAPADRQYEGSLSAASYTVGWILDWDSPTYTSVTIYRPDAKPAYSDQLKDGNNRFYAVWAVDSNGTAARAYLRLENHRSEGQIDLLDPTGKVISTIGTGSYVPQHIAFAPDHTIWTIGYEMDYESRTEDFNVLRHYGSSGKEMNQGLPWLQIAGDYNAYTSLQLCLGDKKLFATRDRIGFVSSINRGRGSWIEVSADGNLLRAYDLGWYRSLYFEPKTMTASGNVYARVFKEDRFDGWAVLDRSTGTWHKVSAYPKGVIIGSDGDNLIFSWHNGAWTLLRSIADSALKIEASKEEAGVAALHE